MNTTVSRSRLSKTTKLVSAVAISLALAGIAYGITEMASHFLQVPMDATASVMPKDRLTSSGSRSASREEPLASSQSPRAVTAFGWIESPRECAPDKGITDACTFY